MGGHLSRPGPSSRTSSPSRARLSRTPGITEPRPDYGQVEPHLRSRQSHGSLSIVPRVLGSRLDYDQVEPDQSSRLSHGSSSTTPGITESRLDYDQTAPHHSSRPSHGSSSTTLGVTESRLDYYQGDLIQARPRVDSHGSSHTSRSTSTGERGNSHSIGTRADNGIRSIVYSHRNSRIGERGSSQPSEPGSDYDDIENRQSTRRTSVIDPVEGLENPAVDFPHTRRRAGFEMAIETGLPTRRTSDSEAPLPYDYRTLFSQPEALARGSYIPLDSAETLAASQANDPEAAGLHRRIFAPSFPFASEEGRRFLRERFDPEVVSEEIRRAGQNNPEAAASPRQFFNHAPIFYFSEEEGRALRQLDPNDHEAVASHRQIFNRASIFDYSEEGRALGRLDPEVGSEEIRRAGQLFGQGSSTPADTVARGSIDPEEPPSTRPIFGLAFDRDTFDRGGALEFLEGSETSSNEDYLPEFSSMVDHIMACFPQVDTSTFAEEDQSCPICTNRYSVPTTAICSESSETEHAIRPPCLHVIGRNCLRRWMEGGKSTCPICRTHLFG